jgi:mRNA interferase RelE/StbE
MSSGVLYGFAYSAKALASLRAIPTKFRGQIVKKVQLLAADPFPQGCKKLHGILHENNQVFRIRSGDYRILYFTKENPSVIVVLDIGDRKEIYR